MSSPPKKQKMENIEEKIVQNNLWGTQLDSDTMGIIIGYIIYYQMKDVIYLHQTCKLWKHIIETYPRYWNRVLGCNNIDRVFSRHCHANSLLYLANEIYVWIHSSDEAHLTNVIMSLQRFKCLKIIYFGLNTISNSGAMTPIFFNQLNPICSNKYIGLKLDGYNFASVMNILKDFQHVSKLDVENMQYLIDNDHSIFIDSVILKQSITNLEFRTGYSCGGNYTHFKQLFPPLYNRLQSLTIQYYYPFEDDGLELFQQIQQCTQLQHFHYRYDSFYKHKFHLLSYLPKQLLTIYINNSKNGAVLQPNVILENVTDLSIDLKQDKDILLLKMCFPALQKLNLMKTQVDVRTYQPDLLELKLDTLSMRYIDIRDKHYSIVYREMGCKSANAVKDFLSNFFDQKV